MNYKVIGNDERLDLAMSTVHSVKEMKEFFGESMKELLGKTSYTFFEVEKGVFCKAYFRMKNGDSLERVFSYKMDDVDYTKFDIVYFYK